MCYLLNLWSYITDACKRVSIECGVRTYIYTSYVHMYVQLASYSVVYRARPSLARARN